MIHDDLDELTFEDDEDDELVNHEAANDRDAEDDHPWTNSASMLQLTDAEKAEAQAWEAQRKEDMEALSAALDPKKNYGLDFEIILWAMDELKQHPEKTIAEVIGYGFCEWVK